MRWPPVSLTSGTSYLSATSAMRRSSAGVQMPPGISGMTENVPSFWMLPWTRSLMKRASRSSSYSPVQIVMSSDASAGLLRRVLDRRQRAREHRRHRAQAALADRLDQLGFASGMDGT